MTTDLTRCRTEPRLWLHHRRLLEGGLGFFFVLTEGVLGTETRACTEMVPDLGGFEGSGRVEAFRHAESCKQDAGPKVLDFRSVGV